MNFFRSQATRSLGTLVLALGLFAAQALHADESVLVRIYDIDRTLFKSSALRTPYVLYDKETGRPLEIPMDQYDKIKDKIGKEEPWDTLELRYKPGPDGSLHEFMEVEGRNPLAENIETMLERFKPGQWQEKAWVHFATDCFTPEQARLTYVLTARGHSSASMYKAFEILQKKGFLRNLPPISSFIGLNFPGLNIRFKSLQASLPRPKPEGKSKVIQEIVKQVVERERAGGLNRKIQVEFFDDSIDNIQKLISDLVLDPSIRTEWANVNFRVHWVPEHGQGFENAEIKGGVLTDCSPLLH